MSGAGADDPPTQPKKGYGFVPKRAKPSREELLRILTAHEAVSRREIRDALGDGRLTSEEARDLIPHWKETEEATAALALHAKAASDAVSDAVLKSIDFEGIKKMREQWGAQLKPIIEAAQIATAPSVPTIGPEAFKNYELEAMLAVKVEVGKVARILETSSEQIGVTAQLAATTVASLDRVHGETKALRDDMRDSNTTITRLTWGLIGLGFVTAGLTGVLVWLTWVLTHQA